MKSMLSAIVAVGCLAVVGCDQNSVLNLPRAKVGAKCSQPGAFARDNVNVLQCTKKKRWAVNMPILRAIAMINDHNRSKVTVPPPTVPPAPAPTVTTPTTTQPVPTPPPPVYPMSVSAGGDVTCFNLSDGRIYCAGRNDHGQLGLGTSGPSGGGVVTVPAGYRLTGVEIGTDHSCGMVVATATNVASIWCWGRNDRGQLGDGTTTDRWSPVPVVGDVRPQSLSVGVDHTCATPNDGAIRAVWCWGADDHGQLGDGTIGGSSSTPVAIAWPAFEPPGRVYAGDAFTCTSAGPGGKVHCWGRNDRGQVGDGTTTDRPEPTEVAGVTTSFLMGVGRAHACASTTGFNIACWGDNSHGQFGDGTVDAGANPTPRTMAPSVGGSTIFHLAAGGDRTCILVNGVRCAGDNSSGQLDPADLDDDVPTFQVPAVGPFAGIDSPNLWGLGDAHTCVVYQPPAWTDDLNEAGCWGDDTYGQASG